MADKNMRLDMQVDEDEFFGNISAQEVIDYYGEDVILNCISEDTVIDHFGIEVKE